MQTLRAEQPEPVAVATVAAPLHPEEQARADLYALIARLLYAAPDAALLASLAGADQMAAQQADHPLDLAGEKLVLAASIMDQYAVAAEFNALFISTGTPPVNPYGSLYLAGSLNEKPLALLRTELARLRLARRTGAGEMEDHLGALCETMRVLIADDGGRAQPLEVQSKFFATHIAPWQQRCLDDIRAAPEANFYRYVADFAAAFFLVESEAFELDDAALAGQL